MKNAERSMVLLEATELAINIALEAGEALTTTDNSTILRLVKQLTFEAYKELLET